MENSKQAKPILVVRLPYTSREHQDETQDQLSAKMPDYHVLTVMEWVNKLDVVRFECYNDISGLNDIDIQELIDEIKSVKNEKV